LAQSKYKKIPRKEKRTTTAMDIMTLFTELGPVISSAGFITFLSALQVNQYMTPIVQQSVKSVVDLVPKRVANLGSNLPGASIVRAILAMLLAIAILGLIYTFVIAPIYSETVERVNNNMSNE